MRLISFLILLFLISSCKQKSNAETPKIEKQKNEIKTKTQVSSITKELIAFAEITFEEGSDINKLLYVKQIDSDGKVTEIELSKGITLYKNILKSGLSEAMPIFEITNSNKIILLVRDKGYMGAIWAKILVDKATLKIKKIQFDHKSESEGYGAGFTLNSFENMFTGIKISFTSNTFGLKQNNTIIIDGDQKIDGISGATITSEAAVKMVNNGLIKYENYLH